MAAGQDIDHLAIHHEVGTSRRPAPQSMICYQDQRIQHSREQQVAWTLNSISNEAANEVIERRITFP